MTNGVQQCFMYLLVIYTSSLEKCLFSFCAKFENVFCVIDICYVFMNSLYILDIKHLDVVCKYCLPFCLLSLYFITPFGVQKIFEFGVVLFVYLYFFVVCALGITRKKFIAKTSIEDLSCFILRVWQYQVLSFWYILR